MSGKSTEAFHDALATWTRAGAQAAPSWSGLAAEELQEKRAELAETTGLAAAAKAHVKSARPMDEIKASYDAMQAQVAEGEPVDYAAMQELADELQPVRMAVEVMRGNYPGTGHTASAGVGT